MTERNERLSLSGDGFAPAPEGKTPIGYVVGGSLKDGLLVRLTVPASTIREGGFVVIEANGINYYGLAVNFSLRSSDLRFSLERAEARYPAALAQLLTDKTLYTEMEVMMCLMQEVGMAIEDPAYQSAEKVSVVPGPVKTIPPHHAPVFLATKYDVAEVFQPKGKNACGFVIGSTREQGHPVHLDMKRFVERSSGIFGATGSGKSYLTRMILAGMIQSRQAVTLVFDMHSEYSYGDVSPDTGQKVLGLKDKLPRNVVVAGLGKGMMIGANKVDLDLIFRYRDVEPRDVEMLYAELNLRDTTGTTLHQLWNSFRGEWFERFMNMDLSDDGELVQWTKNAGVNEQAARGLRSKLVKLYDKPYFQKVVDENPVDGIVEKLMKGQSVILSFGKYDSDLDYLFVTNILTRKIREKWEQMTNEGYQDPSKKPVPLVIALEEAHKLLSPEMASQTSFAVIAREMRKYSVTLLIIDQRPSKIYDEVMSQLGTRVTGWLGDDSDISAVLSGLAGRDRLRGMLSRLQPKEEVLLMGYGVPMPMPIRSRRYDKKFWSELLGEPEADPTERELPGAVGRSKKNVLW